MNESIEKPGSSEPVLLVGTTEIKTSSAIKSRVIIGCFVGLLALGLTNLYSASVGTSFFSSQVKNLTVGLLFFGIFGWVVSPRTLFTYSYWIYGGVCALLILTAVMGHIAGGSQRWIRLGPLTGQPSEFAKISIAIVVARYFNMTRLTRDYTLKDLVPLALVILFAFGLIFEQPDLGTAGVVLLIASVQLCFVRIHPRSFAIVASSSAVVLVVGWFFFLHDYQRLRVLNFLNPNLDPTDTGYNSLQSLVAIGSGLMTGKGFMAGTQAQLQFLPARHTDFIFAVFAEEHGFLGATLVFALFCTLIYTALMIAKQAKDTFSSLLAVGIAAIFFISFFINSAMVLGFFPVVGVPMPFFSHGGTALIMFCMALGILVAIDRDSMGVSRRAKTLERQVVVKSRRSFKKWL
jgi:rod shape determining protein RodA